MSDQAKDPSRDDELRCLEEGGLEHQHLHEEKMESHQIQARHQQKRQPQKSTASEDEDEEDSSQYLIPVLYQGAESAGRSALSSPPLQPTDDESNQYFMSEPSLSEDGDSTSRIRAPHQSDFLLGMVRSSGSDNNNEAHDDHHENQHRHSLVEVHQSGTFQSTSSDDDEMMVHPKSRVVENILYADQQRFDARKSGSELPQAAAPYQSTPENGRRRNRRNPSGRFGRQ